MEKELFSIALGITEPLYIDRVVFEEGELHIHLDFLSGGKFACPECGKEGLSAYDREEKTWRHLNFWQYRTYLHMGVPRIECPDCGVRQWQPPWSRERSGFTLLFEAFVMALAKEMPISRIAELVGEHDTRIWRIVKGYVDRAYGKKEFEGVREIGVDETSSKKGHNYVTVFMDMEGGSVLYAVKGKDKGTIKAFVEEMALHGKKTEDIEEVTMDMSPAFIAGAGEHLSGASITFDKFHVIKGLNEAQDEVRREEVKRNPLLKGTRYVWLKNPENLTAKQRKELETIRHENTKTAKVYQMKLTFQDIYRNAADRESAEAAIKKWLAWAVRSRLEPVKAFARMVKAHFEGILRYFTSRLTSGAVEGLNSRIQGIKRRARGFRNIDNFIAMIYLEAADLDFALPT